MTIDYTSQDAPLIITFDENEQTISMRMALKWWVPTVGTSNINIISGIQLFFTNMYFSELISATTNAEGLNQFKAGENFAVFNINSNVGIIHSDDIIIEYTCKYDPTRTDINNVKWTKEECIRDLNAKRVKIV